MKAGPKATRRHNVALALQQVLDVGPCSRAEIARATGLTRVAVSDLVAELIARQLLAEIGPDGARKPGKRATLLDVDTSVRRIVALDLSDPSLIGGAVLDLRGGIVDRREVATSGLTGSELVEAVTAEAASLATAAGDGLLGIGVGTPGTVDADGVVVAAPNLGWADVPLRRHLADRLGTTVFVENDANLAALAESRFGGGGDDLLLVQLARGVGAGLLVGGRMVTGASFAAGEIGHVVIDADGELCACGKRGCLETWIAGSALSTRAQSRNGEIQSRRAAGDAGARLGEALSVAVGMLDLPELVLHGPEDVVTAEFVDATAHALNSRNRTDFRGDVLVRRSSVAADVVILGACVLVRHRVLGVA